MKPPDFGHCYQMLKQARGNPDSINLNKLLGIEGRNDGGLLERTLREAQAYIAWLERQKNHAELEMDKIAHSPDVREYPAQPPQRKRRPRTPFEKKE